MKRDLININNMNKYINRNYRTKSEFYQSNFEKKNTKNNNHNIQHNLFFLLIIQINLKLSQQDKMDFNIYHQEKLKVINLYEV